MLINAMDLESCTEIEEVLALCVKPMKRLMTDAEQDEIKSIVREDDLELIKELGGTGENAFTKAQSAMLDNFLTYHLMASAKACVMHVYPTGNYTEDDGLEILCRFYLVVIEFALQLVRQSLLNKSLSANGNGTIKSISSNGRSVTFMSGLEAVEQSQLPQALKERLPKPKRVRVW